MVETLTPHRIAQRQKQLDIGKKSREYWRYSACVPKAQRKREWAKSWHPATPDVHQPCSTRVFNGILKNWRRRLHIWGNLDDPAYDLLCSNPARCPIDVVSVSSSTCSTTVTDPVTESDSPSNPVEGKRSTAHHKQKARLSKRFSASARPSPKAASESLAGTAEEVFLSRISVTPVVRGKDALCGLKKSPALLSRAYREVDASKALAYQFCRIEEPVSCDSVCADAAGGEACTAVVLQNGRGTQLPVAFLPVSFRGVQIWPKCLFLREEDLVAALRDASVQRVFQQLHATLSAAPAVLGIPTPIDGAPVLGKGSESSENAGRLPVTADAWGGAPHNSFSTYQPVAEHLSGADCLRFRRTDHLTAICEDRSCGIANDTAPRQLAYVSCSDEAVSPPAAKPVFPWFRSLRKRF